MNLGGAPKGKRAETLHKEQVAREQADPSLRAARARWGPLDDKSMVSWIRGRKWVHDSTLLDAGQAREDADDLPDKPKGGGKLGKKGERRFAASEGRRWATFVNIQPAQHGHVWLKIHGEKIEKYGKRDRLSFVFKTQKTIITRAYERLVKMNEEKE